MKNLTSPLKINTYSTVFEEAESQSIMKKVYIPENASAQEQKIHAYLSKMGAY